MTERIYFISGLGADKRVFAKLNFPSEYDLIYLDWIPPEPHESLKNYAERLALNIDTSAPFILIGLSFGGILATEITKKLNPKHTFIISSVTTSAELPWYYKLAGNLKLQQLIPVSFLKSSNPVSNKLFGAKAISEKKMLKHILEDTDPVFLKWAITCLLNWRNTVRPDNLTHIHGSADKILPVKYARPDIIVKNGGHLMVYSNAKEISDYILNHRNIILP